MLVQFPMFNLQNRLIHCLHCNVPQLSLDFRRWSNRIDLCGEKATVLRSPAQQIPFQPKPETFLTHFGFDTFLRHNRGSIVIDPSDRRDDTSRKVCCNTNLVASQVVGDLNNIGFSCRFANPMSIAPLWTVARSPLSVRKRFHHLSGSSKQSLETSCFAKV